MLSILFRPDGEWWASSEVFERVFQSALDHGEMAPALGAWRDVTVANGGFSLWHAKPAEAEGLTAGLRAAAERELARLGEVDPESADDTYRVSLLKLLAVTLQASLAALLAGDDAEVDALVRGDVQVWQPLLEALCLERHLGSPIRVAAPAFIEAALRRNASFEAWERLADSVAGRCKSRVFSTVTQATRAWSPWFFHGMERVRASTSPEMLGARFSVLLRGTGDDELAQVRALVADARPIWRADPRLGAMLQLLHRRAGEEGAHAEALDAIREAEAIHAAAADAQAEGLARRLEGASLLQLRRFDEAWAVLDVAMQTPRPMFEFAGGGSFRLRYRSDSPRDRALKEAADLASWATPTDAAWVRALGVLAETHSDATLGDVEEGPDLWQRFDRCLGGLVAGDNAEEGLETVIQEAEERGMIRVAERAKGRVPEA